MYLNPQSSSYQWALLSHVFISYLDHAVSSKLHLPINSLFQCFPHAPKLLSTLRLGEVSVWVKNLSMMFTIFSQKFLGKTPYNFVGNMGLYSVGKGMRKKKKKKKPLKCSSTKFCGSLATWPESQSDSRNPA